MTQYRAARFVMNVPYHYDRLLTWITAVVRDLGWESLQTRRLHHRLIMLYRVTNCLVKLLPDWPDSYTMQLLNTWALHAVSALSTGNWLIQICAFLPRTILDWNVLPRKVVEGDSLNQFKWLLSQSYQFWLYHLTYSM